MPTEYEEQDFPEMESLGEEIQEGDWVGEESTQDVSELEQNQESTPQEDTTETSIESEGILFSPEDDPLTHPIVPTASDPRPVSKPYVSKRLRHLICERQMPMYKEPSGRTRPKG